MSRSRAVRFFMAVFVAVLFVIGLMTSSVMAFSTTTGTELQSAYDTIEAGITGYWGLTFAIICVGVGIYLAWQFRNPLIFLGAIVVAVIVPNIPTIVSAMGACF